MSGIVSARNARLRKEISGLLASPPPAVSTIAPSDWERLDELKLELAGPEESPYQGGKFRIRVNLPERYPFEPPHVTFLTPVYHPNIDSAGRICLDLLKPLPAGSWRPTVSLSALFTTLQLLLAQPNPQDPLCAEIAQQYLNDRAAFNETATSWTKTHAVDLAVVSHSVEPEEKRPSPKIDGLVKRTLNLDKENLEGNACCDITPVPVKRRSLEH